MKNLDDAFTFGDQFLNDKLTKEETGKANMETEVESMVTIPIHQASSSAPPLSTPIINLTTPKLISPPVQEPVFTATTSTTTTTTLNLLPPPLQQQSTTDPELANRVSALEEICANLVKKNKHQDQTTQALSSRMFMLENHDLYSKIDSYIIETVKESIQNVLQAPVCERFRELSEFEMKEILRDRISSSTSFKRVGPKEEEKHDSDTSGSKQSQAQTSLAWKTSNTREAPSSSSKQRTAPQSEQTVNDVPIPDDVYILDTQDTDAAHLLKIKTKPDWLKPVLEEESPETLKPD
ncbi:hypothetical protein Tco_0066574 [Tanacetum coccineum]